MRCVKCGREFPSEYYFKPGGVCVDCDARLTPDERQQLTRPTGLRRMTSTTFDLPGHRVVEALGVVRGITVRSRSIFGTIGGALQTVVGGNITLFTDLCEQTRNEAFDMLLQHAAEIGANAVLGVRYDATEVMDGVTEVLCYGTAVVVERIGA
jgi:uncharacterized protein YbjQ (UPF0145 family)/DNA-directed RNA polymerase subunit RPC12/RpoP